MMICAGHASRLSFKASDYSMGKSGRQSGVDEKKKSTYTKAQIYGAMLGPALRKADMYEWHSDRIKVFIKRK